MENVTNWLEMGGYASWVWSAYALWAAAFAWLCLGTLNGRRRVRRQLQDQQRRAELKAQNVGAR